MANLLRLPTDKKDLAEAVDQLLIPAFYQRNLMQVRWWITDYYLRGFRSFQVLDYQRGTVELAYEDEDGNIHLRWDEVMTRTQTEVGRLARLDLAPVCSKQAYSLESLRGSAISQVLLDHMLRGLDRQSFDTLFWTMLVQYGTVGVYDYETDVPGTALGYNWELVPPWELLGIPAGISCRDGIRGIARTRMIPYAQLQEIDQLRLPKERNELGIEAIDRGSDASPAGRGDMFPTGSDTHGSIWDMPGRGQNPLDGSKDPKVELMVPLRELWCVGPQNSVYRYIVKAGRAIVFDTGPRPPDKLVPMPLGIARYQDTGHFYGKDFPSKVIPFAMKLEGFMERLIEAGEDQDRFGIVLVPDSWGVSLEDLMEKRSPRVAFYSPDMSMPNIEVRNIQPIAPSTVYANLLDFGLGMIDRAVGQGPLYGGIAPGRADSGEAFQVLATAGATSLIPTAASAQGCFSTVYRSMLHRAHQKMLDPEVNRLETIVLARIENSIAGIRVDPRTGNVSLDPNALPDPYAVNISVRSTDADTQDRRRNEAVSMLQMGLLTPLEFIILNYKENWKYPIGSQSVWEQYIKSVLYNLALFADGQTPGPYEINMNVDKPEVQLLAMEDFTSAAEFDLASDEVKNKFADRMDVVRALAGVGGGFPPQLPRPDEAAMMSALQQRGPGGGSRPQPGAQQ